jgi:hypothetical protein
MASKAEKAFEKILEIVQQDLEHGHRIKVKQRLADNWTHDTKGAKEILDDIGMKLNPRAQTLMIKGHIFIYINPEIVKKLVKHNPLEELSVENYREFLSVVEEVSHVLYIGYYGNRYGEKPQHCTTELVGAVDKYLEMQRCKWRIKGKLLSFEEDETVIDEIAGRDEAHKMGVTPGTYVIGHRLAKEYVKYLMKLFRIKGGKAMDKEIDKFYEMRDNDKIKRLIFKIGLGPSVHSDTEKADTKRILEEMGIGVDIA